MQAKFKNAKRFLACILAAVMLLGGLGEGFVQPYALAEQLVIMEQIMEQAHAPAEDETSVITEEPAAEEVPAILEISAENEEPAAEEEPADDEGVQLVIMEQADAPAEDETPVITEEPSVEEIPAIMEIPAILENLAETEEFAQEDAESTEEATDESYVASGEEHFAEGYVTVKEGTAFYAQENAQEPKGVFAADGFVFARIAVETESPAEDWLWVVFDTAEARETGADFVEGFVQAKYVNTPAEDELSLLVDAMAADEAARMIDNQYIPCMECTLMAEEDASDADEEIITEEIEVQEVEEVTFLTILSSEVVGSQIPTLASAVQTEEDSVRLTWSAVAGVDGYAIWVRKNSEQSYSEAFTVAGSDVTETTVSGLEMGVGYNFKVSVYSEADGKKTYGTLSNVKSVTIGLLAPVWQSITKNGDNGIKLSWSAVSGASGYSVYQSDSADGSYKYANGTVGEDVTSLELTGYEIGKTYYFKVRAYAMVDGNKVLSPNQSEVGSIIMKDEVVIIETAPVLAKAEQAGLDSIKVEWEAVDGADGYAVWMRTISNTEYEVVYDAGEELSATIDGLTMGTQYYVKVSVYTNVGGEARYGKLSNVKGVTIGLPAPTLSAIRQTSMDTVELKWSEVEGADGYSVYRRNETEQSYSYAGGTTESGATTLSLGNVEYGETYHYKVRAYIMVDGTKKLSPNYSSVKSITIGLLAPEWEGISQTGNNKIELHWSAVSGASGYSVYQSDSADGSYKYANGTVGEDVTSLELTGYEIGKTYYFKVRAYAMVDGVKVLSPNQSEVISITLEAVEPLSVEAITVEGATVTGETATWKVQAAGGKAPYFYNYQLKLNGNNVGDPVETDADTFAAVLETAGVYSLSVTVVDAFGNSAFAEGGEITVEEAVAYTFTTAENEDGTLTITGYKGELPAELEIPAAIDGKAVTAIGLEAFIRSENITKLTIPSSVTMIGEAAFYGCSGLTELVLPEGLVSIDIEAFADCKGLKSVSIPSTLTEIGDASFMGTDALENIVVAETNPNYKDIDGVLYSKDGTRIITYPAGRTDEIYTIEDGTIEIYNWAFYHCNNLKELVLPEGVTTIYRSAFSWSENLEKINLPESISSLGEDDLEHCFSWSDVVATVIEGSYAHIWCEENGVNFEIFHTNTFTTSENEDGTLTITGFDGEVPANLVIPGEIDGKAVTDIGDGAFEDQDSIETLESVVISEGIKVVGYRAFAGCDLITTVSLPASVEKLHSELFGNGLATITLAEGNEYYCVVDGVLFTADMRSMEIYPPAKEDSEYTIPDGVEFVEISCAHLGNITVPASVTDLAISCGDNATITIYGMETEINWIDNNNGNITIYGYEGSTAQAYAEENGCTFEALEIEHTNTFTTSENEDGTLTITGFDGEIPSELEIPSEIDGKTVTAIADRAFADRHGLEKITLPSSITSIGEDIFANIGVTVYVPVDCYVYEFARDANWNYIPMGTVEVREFYYEEQEDGTVYITDVENEPIGTLEIPSEIDGKTVSGIAGDTFWGWGDITSVIIPSTVKVIGQNAFRDCHKLASVTLNVGLEEIGDHAFASCESLTEVVIPEGVKYIYDCAFENCHSLTLLDMPGSLIEIGENNIVGGCVRATFKVVEGESVAKYYAMDWGIPYDDGSGYALTIMEVFEVDNGYGRGLNETATWGSYHVGGNGEYQYQYKLVCSGEELFTTEWISEDTYSHKLEKTGHYMMSVNVKSGDEETGFKDCNETVIVGSWDDESGYSINIINETDAEIVGADQGRLSGPVSLPATVAGYNIIGIERGVFHDDDDITSIIIPEGYTYIDHSTFANMDSLVSVTLPQSLTDIRDYAFSSSSNLQSVNLPEGLTYLGEGAFSHCYALNNITIPAGIKYINSWTFQNCWALSDVTIANGVETIGEYAFQSSGVTEIIIPDSVYDIGGWAFQDCYDLRTVDMSASAVTALHNYVFQYSELKNISLPAGLTHIGAGVFSCCSLEHITLPENLSYLGQNAFEDCENLKGITIPAGVTDIGDKAFESCYQLTDVNFEGDIISIGNRSFNRCHSLKTITIPESIQSIGEFAFEQCHNLGDLVLPTGPIGFGQHVFMDSNVTLIVEIGSDAYYYVRDFDYDYVPMGAAEFTGFHYEDEGEGSIIITGYYGSEGFITIPSEIDGKTVTGIGDDAFAWHGEITGVTIPATVNTIGSWAFQGTGLTYVNFEEGSELYLIGESAFEECNRLTEVILPDGVGDIGDGAFANCSSLTKLHLPESLETIGSDLIDGSKLCVLYVVEGSAAEAYAIAKPYPYNNGTTNAHYGVMDVNVYRWTNDVNDYAIWQANVVEPNEAYEIQYQIYRNDVEYGEPSKWTTDLRYTYNFFETMETGDYRLGARMRLVSDPDNTVTDFVVGEEIMHISRCDEVFRYQIVDGEDGYNAIIYGYDSDEIPETLEIPATLTVYNGAGEEFTAKVTCIGEDALRDRGGMKHLVLPNTIVSIQASAFHHCWDLESVDLPDNLLFLMDHAFAQCDRLKSVTIPGTIREFGREIFVNCHELETVTFEEGLTFLGREMFANDRQLHTVNLPNTLVSTGDFVFADCGNLSNINLPTGLKTINDYTFAGCWGLKGIEIPNTVETIGQSAFYHTGLYSVEIPDSVTNIGPIAFDSCTDLQSVTLSKNLTELKNYTFANCHSLNNVVVHEGVTSLGTAVFAENYSLNNITLPDSLTSIGRDCFFKCGSLGEIEIGANVTDFGDNIFGEAHNVTIVTTVGAPVGAYAREHGIDYKAYGTASSEQLQIELNGETMQATVVGYGPVEEGQEYIPLEGTLNIPGTVEDGEGNTYTVTAIGNHALEGYGALTGVILPDSVEVIGEWAFGNDHHLESIAWPVNLKRIEVDAFNGCHGLTRVDIPDGCVFLGGGAFANCSNLRQIHIPDSVTDFHDGHLLDNSPLAVVYCNPGSKAEEYAINWNKPYNNGQTNTLAILSVYATQWAGGINETATWEVIANGDNLQYMYEVYCNGSLVNEPEWTDSNSYSYTFPASGIYQLKAYIRNSEDQDNTVWADCDDEMFISVNAQDESGWRYVCYAPDEEGNFFIGISGYDGEIQDGTLVIPDTIDGHIVDGILNNVFENRGELEHVVLNDTIISIGNWAFNNCGNLQSIDFGESPVYYIGHGAFENTHNLGSITLPSTTEGIEDSAFKNSGLESIVLSANLKGIGNHAFDGCGNLSYVDFSACTQLEEINHKAFYECGSLANITIPEGVTKIYSEAFRDSGLQNVTLPSTLVELEWNVFENCHNLASINLQDTALTTIGGNCFAHCCALTSIELPDTVVTIDGYMFQNCYSLKSAVLSDGQKNLGWGIFENCHRLESVTLPANLETIANYAFKNCHSLSNLTIPGTVYGIGEEAFVNCGMLGDLVIPETVTVLEGDNVFGGANVTLFVTYDSAAYHYAREYELDYVVSGAVADVNRLNYYYEEDEEGNPYLVVNGYEGELEGELNIPAQLPWDDGYLDVGIIDWNAFEGQNRLTKVIIPGTVFVIGGWAFNDCRNLQEVELNEGLVEIYDHAFKNCERLTKVVVPDGVKYIGYNAFCNNPMLEELHLPGSIEKMDDSLIEGSKRCVLHVVKGSYAESYAIENGLTYDNGETQPFKVMEVYGLNWTDVVGDESSWGAHVVGGEGALQYHYVLKRGDEEFDLGWSDDPIARYTYREGGDYRMTLQVKDSTGAVTDFCECEDVNIIGWEDEETRLRYNYVGENEIKITSYIEDNNHVVIPQTIGEDTVVGIAAGAFRNRDYIESVQLPSTIRFIDNEAFAYCHSLTSINLEETQITEIGSWAFECVCNIENITLPETLIYLHDGVFGSCTRLQSMTIPASVESIGDGCFEGCEEMTSFTFETTKLTEIDSGVFASCRSLAEIEIPEGVKLIRERAFQNTGLKTVTLPSTLEELEWSVFEECCQLTSINLQDTALTTIGEYAFAHCCSLTSIELPDTVVTVDGYMFKNCHSLKSAVMSDGQKYLGWGAFENCHRLENITLPGNLESIANYAFKNCHSLSNLTIPATVYGIGEEAFVNCGMLGDLVIPETVTVLEGDNVFGGANVTLFVTYDSAAYHYAREYGLDYVVSGAVADVNRLNYYYEEDEEGNPYLVVNGYEGELEGELNIPGQLPWGDGYLDVGIIDWSAFQGQERLTKVSIPGTVFLIGGSAFNGCRNLQEVQLHEGLVEIYDHAFINCERLTKVVVPDGVKYVGHNAFAYCHNLEELHLPESIEKMDDSLVEGSKRCVLHVEPGSYAESYAIAKGYTYDNGETKLFKVMEVYGLGWTDVVGDESSWGAHVVGGEGALQYHYVLKRGDEEFDLGWSDDPIARYTYREGGDYRMTLQVKDSTGAVTDFCECEDVNIIGWEDEETRLRYNYVGDNEIKITSYADENNHVVIPQMIGENTVVGIASHAFHARDNIESVQLPSTIRFIDDYAFQYCHNLTSINLQDTQITEIGEWAFECVCNIENITLPETLIWLHDGVFGSCPKLQSITIPANVQGIGDSCFEGCEEMTSVTFNTTKLTEIDSYAFGGCRSLTEIAIPEGVKLIRSEAFRNTGVEKVTLPSTLEELEESVFAECCKLTSINLQDTALTTIGEGCFECCCELTSIELPDTVVTVDANMFLDCHKLETAVMSDGQKYLGWRAFEGCYALKSVTLPANLESIANYAFRFCHSLETLKIPDSVYGIGEYAFEWSGLRELTLGKNVTHLEDNIFENCGAVLNVYNDSAALEYAREYGLAYYIMDAQANPENIQYYFAEGEDGTKEAIVTGYNGDLIGSLEIPATATDDEGNVWPVTVIDAWVFGGCEDLMSVSIPASVMCIGDGAFAGCWRMKTVNIAEGSQLEEIWHNAFQDCSMMKSINLENATQLKTLGDRVFKNCSNLNEITIPASVTEIGEEINDDCPLLLFHVTAGTYGETYCIDNGLAYDAGNGFGLNVQWVTVVEDAWNVGDTATWRVFSVGGENVTYQYTVYRAGEKYYQDEDFTDSDHFSFQFTENGAYMLGVTAKSVDSEGNETYAPLDKEGNPGRKHADRKVIISEEHESGFTYSILENNSDDDGTYEVAITGCNDEMVGGDVTIPATLTIGEIEYDVVKITAEAFRDNGSITSLIVPEGVREIEESAFEHMYRMKSCVLPSTVTELPSRIFAGCDQMESVVIPNVKEIPWEAFRDCESLLTIELPANLEGIEGYAFFNCRSLVITAIPDGVEGIDERAFARCYSLDRLVVPDNIDFGEAVFNDTDVTIVANVDSEAAYYAMDWNYNLDAQGTMDPAGFYWNQGETATSAIITGYDGRLHGHVEIPETVTAEGNTYTVVGVDAYTFTSSEYITELTIPATMVEIDDVAFAGCIRLRTLNIEGESLKTIGMAAFADCWSLNDFTIPSTLTEIGAEAFYNDYSLRELTIPEGVTKIGDYAFANCDRLCLKVTAGSAAETYAIANGLAYDNDGAGYKLTMQQVELEDQVFDVGETATWLFHAVGGSGELQYQYQLYRNGAAYTEESNWTTEAEYSYKFTETGDYELRVRVQDENAVPTGYIACKEIVTILTLDEETGYVYAIVGENSVRVLGAVEENFGAEMTVPAQLAGKPVTQIGADMFSWDERIETVTLPDTIEWIADYAFDGCKNLRQINMPASLKIIGMRAFAETYSLESVELPEGLTTIGYGAFTCSGLTEIAIPATIEELGNHIFASCEELTTAILPEGLEEIPNEMFAECYKLTGVTIPNTVKAIGDGAFVACGSITQIEIPAAVTHIGDQAFRYCVGLQSVTLNEGLQEIGVEGFYMCRNLESISLPESVTRMRAYAFGGCEKLASVKLSTKMDYLANGVFTDCTALTSIDLHEGIWSIGSYTFAGCTKLGNVTLPSTLTSIEQSAFFRCESMTEVVIPNSVKDIGPIAFDSCYALESVTLPDQLTKLNNFTFANCHSLKSIIIPDGVIEIGKAVFAECYDLASVTLPSTLESIGYRAFFMCSALNEITIPASVNNFGEEVFLDTPEGFTMHVTADSAAAEYAVANNHEYTVDGKLVSGEFLYMLNSEENGVVLMGYMGEETSVVVPETIADLSIVEIGDGAFENNATMTAIDLPDTITIIGARAFANCTSLTTMT